MSRTEDAGLLRDLLAADAVDNFLEPPERAALGRAIELLEQPEPKPRPAGEPNLTGRSCEFVVYGDPRAQGSKVARVSKTGSAYMHEQNAAELRRWRRAVSDEANLHRVGWVKQSPLVIELTFMHRATKEHPVGFKATAPDIDKLARAVLDACTHGGLWVDDAQVVKLLAQKVYGQTPGVRVRVREAR